MGGVAGHMSHLYENPDLTFAEMKEIFQSAAEGKLIGTEKTDGQNLFISYSIKDGRAKAARNAGNIKTGGLDAAGLASKFEGRGTLYDAFVGAFGAFVKAAETMPPELSLQVFGPDANIYYNAEVMDPDNPNVINYDDKTLLIHQVGHKTMNDEGNIIDADASDKAKLLQDFIEQYNASAGDPKFRIRYNMDRVMDPLEDQGPLIAAAEKLDAAAGDNLTVGELTINGIKDRIRGVIQLPEDKESILIAKILGHKGYKINDVKAGLDPESINIVLGLYGDRKTILRDIIAPIESIVHDFSVEVLKKLESTFILDNKKETERLRARISQAKNIIEKSGYEEAIEVLQNQMAKIKDVDAISTAAEGFVFNYNGFTYKFTGNFAPVNQILGMFEFGRGGVPPLKDLADDYVQQNQPVATEEAQLLIEQEIPNKSVVVLYPGGFKPPHAGHYELVARYANDPKVKEVRILLGSNVRTSRDNTIKITESKSRGMWNNYYLPAMETAAPVIVGDMPPGSNNNPMRAAYKFIELEAEDNEIYALAASDKDPGRVDSFVMDHAPETGKYNVQFALEDRNINVIALPVSTMPILYGEMTAPRSTEEAPDPLDGTEVSATVMREDLASENLQKFASNLPGAVVTNPVDVERIFNFLRSDTSVPLEETISYRSLFSLVESVLKEKTKVSGPGQKRISQKIGYLIDKEDKKPDQAAAIAYSMEERGELAEEETVEEASTGAGGAVEGPASGGRKRVPDSIIREEDKVTSPSWEGALKAIPRSARGQQTGKPIRATSWRDAIKRDAGMGSFDDPAGGGLGEPSAGNKYKAALARSEKEQIQENVVNKQEIVDIIMRKLLGG